MITFYICRHGQTEFNLQRRLSGWIDTPLTPAGLANVQTSAGKLTGISFDAIYSSDLGRSFITAYLIAKHLQFDTEIIRVKALRENGYGDLAALPIVEAEARYPELHKTTDYIPPNGESLGQLQARVIDFIAELDIAANGVDQTILLSAHDGVIKAIYANFANLDLGFHNSDHEYPNDFVACFAVDASDNHKISTFTEITL
jgi:probable phosphoglycerate mutase